MVKINPNAPCPCGSGKKYKKCCGAPQNRNITDTMLKDYQTTDLQLADFVKKNLASDASFLTDAVQLILGPWGYNYCVEHAKDLTIERKKDLFRSFVEKDTMKIYSSSKSREDSFEDVRPFHGLDSGTSEDLVSLLKKGFIDPEWHQIFILHRYIIDYLIKRFPDYLYLPNKDKWVGQVFGSFLHRGYDFLMVMSLYLELQLGMHVMLSLAYKRVPPEVKEVLLKAFHLKELNMDSGMAVLQASFIEAVCSIIYKYNYSIDCDLELMRKHEMITQEQYNSRAAQLNGVVSKSGMMFRDDYTQYLFELIRATCTNDSGSYAGAAIYFSECDVVKYMCGLESIVHVFQDRTERVVVSPKSGMPRNLLDWMEANNYKVDLSERTVNKYHEAVFYMMDERNIAGTWVSEINYDDALDFNDYNHRDANGVLNYNPAKKANRAGKHRIRKLRMELYSLLNGQFLSYKLGNSPGSYENLKKVAAYPLLPWISNGKEKCEHIRPFDGTERDPNAIYSMSLKERQEMLTMEYRLTEIPVNAIEEFLNPDVYYLWKIQQEHTKTIEEQKNQLERILRLNQTLVRSLSHSAGNYLNSNNLEETGLKLNSAIAGNPTIEQLHMDGIALLMQSEQELYLQRQLNSLSWRCTASTNELMEQIQDGLDPDVGCSILNPVEYALKTILTRVLFREDDNRSRFIAEKLKDNDELWTSNKTSFLLDVLADRDSTDGNVIAWWRQHISPLSYSASPEWEQLNIRKKKPFFDLVVELLGELLLNALSHGKPEDGICIYFGQAEEFQNKPRWVYIECINVVGDQYPGGKEIGLQSLHEMLLLLNSQKRGWEYEKSDGRFRSRFWLSRSYLRALKRRQGND